MDFLENLIPLVAIVMVFGIPIAAILTAHQRRMAELMSKGQEGNVNQAVLQELQSMRAEISGLKNQVNEQMLAIDNLRSPAPGELQSRIEN